METTNHFPQNLISDIEKRYNTGIHLLQGNLPIKIDEQELPNYLAKNLDSRTYQIMLERYEEGHTLQCIGKQHNLTIERIRQIITKTLCVLSHPSKIKEISMIPYSVHEVRLRELKILEGKYNDLLSVLRETFKNSEAREVLESCLLKNTGAKNIEIENLDLSVRAYNSLKRAGYDTIDDIINAGSDKLAKTRNLSKRCFDEVVSKVNELGFEFKEE